MFHKEKASILDNGKGAHVAHNLSTLVWLTFETMCRLNVPLTNVRLDKVAAVKDVFGKPLPGTREWVCTFVPLYPMIKIINSMYLKIASSAEAD